MYILVYVKKIYLQKGKPLEKIIHRKYLVVNHRKERNIFLIIFRFEILEKGE